MKTFTTLRSAAIATIAVAAFSLPTLAQASDFYRGYDASRECKSKENDAKLVGGLLGAVVGGVIGSQVSGNGARTEGSAVGAVLGGLAGAGIGDESVDCNKRRTYRSRPYSGQTYGSGYNSGYTPAHYRYDDRRRDRYRRDYRYDDYRHRDHRYRHDHVHTQACYDTYGYGSSHFGGGYNNGTVRALEDVRYRLRNLRRENRELEAELRYGYDYRTQQRLDWVCKEIRRLEKKERRLARRLASY